MADEEVKVRFEVEGTDEAKTAVEGVTGAIKEHEEHVNRAGESHTKFSHKVRGAAHIITGTVGQMAGAVNPELGRIVGSLGLGAHMFRYFGAQVAIAVTAVEMVSTAITFFIKQMKEAEDFQLSLAKATREWDLGAVHTQLSKVNEQLERFRMRADELNAPLRTDILGSYADAFRKVVLTIQGAFTDTVKLANEQQKAIETATRLFEQTGERRKIDLEVQQEQLKVQAQQANFDVKRATDVDTLSAALDRQVAVTRQQAEAAIELHRIEEQRQIRKLLAEGLDAEAVARTKAMNAKELSERAALNEKIVELVKEREDKIAGMQEKEQQRSFDALKKFTDARTLLMGQEHTERLRLIDVYETGGSKVVSLERENESASRDAATSRINMINLEIEAVRQFAQAHAGNVEVQRRTQAELQGLQNERLKVEVDTNRKIADDRRQMVDKLRSIEEEKAVIGGSLEDKAMGYLRQHGFTGNVTQELLRNTVENLQSYATEVAQQWQLGGEITQEQRDLMKSFGPDLSKLRKTGASTREATYLAEQQLGSEFGLRISPAEMIGAPAPETTLSPQSQAVVDSMVKVQSSIDALTKALEEGGTGAVGNIVNVIYDALVRKLEFEAARQA